MPRRSRWLWIATTVIAAIYIAASTYVVARLVETRQLIGNTYRTGSWAAVQLQQEYDRLLVADLWAEIDRTPARYDALGERYDIFWSRLIILETGVDAEGVRQIPGVTETLKKLRAALEATDRRLGLDGTSTRMPADAPQIIRQSLAGEENGIRELVRYTQMQDQYVYNRGALVQIAAEMIIYLSALFVLGLCFIALAMIQARRASGLYREARAAKADANRLSLAIAASSDAIALTDPNGCFTAMNRAHLEMFGIPSSQAVLGKAWTTLYSPAEHERLMQEIMPELEARNHWHGHAVGQTLNGDTIDQDMSVTLLDDGGMLCISRDVTRQRADAETRRRLEERLVVAQKMEAIGRLASGFAHDFNNVLGSIQGYAEIIEDAAGGEASARRFAGQILTGVRRGQNLVDRIMGFARPRRGGGAETCNLAAAVDEAAGLLIGALPKGMTLSVTGTASDLKVDMPADQLIQVLMNLGVNARDALGGGRGQIRIQIAGPQDFSTDAPVRLGSRQADRRYIRLVVEDDGCGIPESQLVKIFEPLFTTKPEGSGTGLGLAVVHGIVTAHGGEIAVWSTPGKGTRFELLLPLAKGEATQPAAAPEAETAPQALRVLLVDDDKYLSEAAGEALTRAGHHVEFANDGESGLAVLRNRPGAIDVVLTDDLMPGIRGPELIRRLREQGNLVPIVLWSANADSQTLDEAGIVGPAVNVEFCSKPVSTTELLATLQRAASPILRQGLRSR
ncbi:response regulator [Oleomonas cavernae]|uniref:histidine kinase n=1 Tax=Oleomonas cavernae TaxID=2320859 RepID=A0A418WAV1_9PROT|nr:ATP-binding protein [Oleomonas cavernae]RJF87119.1 response regulator [Oleomonas cavernae]